MMERVLGPGLRGLFGIVGVAALIAGIVVAATEVRLLFVGSPPIPTLLAAIVAGVAALGGGLVLRGAVRGRVAVRSPRGRRNSRGQDTVSDGTDTPVFGAPPAQGSAIVRPSAYGLVIDSASRLAIVRTPQGVFLPGGGIDPGETPGAAVIREVREECGLEVQLGSWTQRAVDFVYSETERANFEKHSTFIDAHALGVRSTPQEADHELEWVAPREAMAALAHPSHRWAVEQWLRR